MDAAGTLDAAIAAHRRGAMADAERLYRAVLNDNPGHADACALLAVVLGARGAFDDALRYADRAVVIDPASGLLHFHRGNVLMAAQKLPDAIAALEQARALQPNMAQVHYNLANALRAAGDWPRAIDSYRAALALDPASPDTANNLALSLVHEKQIEEAQIIASDLTARVPGYGEGWITLCNVAEKTGDYRLALSAGRRAIEIAPQNHYAWFGYGVALNRLNRDADAIDAYTRALALEPGRADIWDNIAQSYQSMNELDKAYDAYRQAVDVAGQAIVGDGARAVDEEEYGNRHWHLGLVELLRGDYKSGFAHYRARFKSIPELKRLSMPFPLWRGEDLTGKTLLVCDEQGFGDTLMLARFLPVLRARGARVVFSVHPVLKSFFADWDGADAVIAHEGQVPPCDFHCSSFDLPYWLGVTRDTVPAAVPYLPVLSPDADTFLPAAGMARKIGVVWGGSALHKGDAKRSVPLRLMAKLFDTPGAAFYSFNRDMKEGDAALLPRLPVENLAPALKDFAAAARLIGQMDLVITCDTATAHLAGGLGKPVWILLPFAPDWRWLTGRADTVWYPTARLFRQPRQGDWTSVVADVKAALMNVSQA
ncbi:MAG: tetratricopeptide repeat protein [Alphaproteobacteria bacterium]|nr:tetratricopeptide repeat protein [Alphaproteobacteria bacterium]